MSLFGVVNVSSRLIEQPEADRTFEVWEPVLWEASSIIVLLALAPLVWRALQRWPLQPPWLRAASIHFGLTLPYSLVHVLLMVAIRHLVYALHGWPYQFAAKGWPITLFYEWRKDVLSYALFLGLFWIEARLRQRPEPAPASSPLAIRVDGAVLHLKPSDIRLVTAAGNYVEFHLADGARLSRMTLAEAARLLGPDFIQVHRSRLVNRSLVRAERPQPSGDVELELADGSRVMASRRFRDRLPSSRRVGPAPVP
jgi:hypothetical protein